MPFLIIETAILKHRRNIKVHKMSLYSKAKKLKEERFKIRQDQLALNKVAKDEERQLTTEEDAKWTKMNTDMDAKTVEIDAAEADIQSQENRAADLESRDYSDPRFDVTPQTNPNAPDPDAGKRAFNAWLRGGNASLNQEQRTLLNRARPAGVPQSGDMISFDMLPTGEMRAQASGTNSAGGYTVPEDFQRTLVEATLQFGGMRQLPTTKITTSDGADLPIPKNDDTSNSGAILAENSQDSETPLAFGVTTLGAFMYTSDIVLASVQFMQDSAFDMNAFIGKKLGERIGRITNTHFTTGDGSSKPLGIMAAADVGKAVASASTLTFDELLALKHSVDPSYRQNARWMFNDSTLLVIKKLSIGTADARPLWQPSVIVGEPDTIDGDQFQINQDVATIAASAKTVAYGDFSAYWIRDVTGMTLLRLTERYADYLQVGFIAFSRHDGDYVDAGTAPIKVIQHPTA